MQSAIGGGSLPGEGLESVGLVVTERAAAALAARLRAGMPPVVGRVQGGAVLLDLRTIDRADDTALINALVAALSTPSRKPGAT